MAALSTADAIRPGPGPDRVQVPPPPAAAAGPSPSTPKPSASSAKPNGHASPLLPPAPSSSSSSSAGGTRTLRPPSPPRRASSSNSQGTVGTSGRRRRSGESDQKKLKPSNTSPSAPSPAGEERQGLPNSASTGTLSAIGGFLKTYTPVALFTSSPPPSSSTDAPATPPSPLLARRDRDRRASPAGAGQEGSPRFAGLRTPLPASTPPSSTRTRMVALPAGSPGNVTIPGGYYFSPDLNGVSSPPPPTNASPTQIRMTSPDANLANAKYQAGLTSPVSNATSPSGGGKDGRRRVVSESTAIGSNASRGGGGAGSDDDGGGFPGLGALLNGLPTLNPLNVNWNIGNLLGLGGPNDRNLDPTLDGSSELDEGRDGLGRAIGLAPGAKIGGKKNGGQDLRRSMDLRIEDASHGGLTYFDANDPSSQTAALPPNAPTSGVIPSFDVPFIRKSAELLRPVVRRGASPAQSATAPEGEKEAKSGSGAEAATTPPSAGTTTGGAKSRPALFQLQTPSFSRSSPSNENPPSAGPASSGGPNSAGGANLSRRGSTPLSPALVKAGAEGGFDPLTLHALAREHSETEVLRAVRERDERLYALARVVEEDEPHDDVRRFDGQASVRTAQVQRPAAQHQRSFSAAPGASTASAVRREGSSAPTAAGRAAHARSASVQVGHTAPSLPSTVEAPARKTRQASEDTVKASAGAVRASTDQKRGSGSGTASPVRGRPASTSVSSSAPSTAGAGKRLGDDLAPPKSKKTLFSRLGLAKLDRVPSGSGPPSSRASSIAASSDTVAESHSSSLGGSTLVSDHASHHGSASLPNSASHASFAAAGSKGTKYIRVKVKNKDKKEFRNLFLAQELSTAPAPSPSSSAAAAPTSPVLSDAPSRSGSKLGHHDSSGEGSNGTGAHKERRTPSATSLASTASGSSSSSSEASDAAAGGATASASGHGPAPKRRGVWALKFSTDGSHLAAGCQDGVVRVWAVVQTEEERQRALLESLGRGGETDDLTTDDLPTVPLAPTQSSKACAPKRHRQLFHMPVFSQKPCREFKGHTADVLDVSWSKNGFLLSSSIDKTVRLWHVSQPDCLVAFEHPDLVTAVNFHPKDDRFFISGSLDCKLRLWNIVEKRVHSWTELPDLITSVAFTADGKRAAAGTYVGAVLFFDCETLKYYTTIHARSARGKNSKGRKVTSVFPVPGHAQERMLITTNDSRIRMYNLAEKTMVAKYKGLTNATSQVRATMSDDGKYVISGSEDRHIHIWDAGVDENSTSSLWTSKKSQSGQESFMAHSNITTCAVFAPLAARCLLDHAGDPVFKEHPDLMALYREASTTPGATPMLGSANNSGYRWEPSVISKVIKGSSADGAIIATADDHTGMIRIYRNSSLSGFADPAAQPKPPSRRESVMSSLSNKNSPAVSQPISRRGSAVRISQDTDVTPTKTT